MSIRTIMEIRACTATIEAVSGRSIELAFEVSSRIGERIISAGAYTGPLFVLFLTSMKILERTFNVGRSTNCRSPKAAYEQS